MTAAKNRNRHVLAQILYLLIGAVIVFPMIYALFASLLKPKDILSYPPKFFPTYYYVQNYWDALNMTQLIRYIWNSVFVSTATSIFRIIIGSLCAYGFAFFNFKGKHVLFFLVLGTMMIPPDAIVVTNYLTVARMGLVNTYLGIMIIFMVSAFHIFMMRQYFLTVSNELRDAAYVDGISNFQFFYMILMPLSKPVLSVVFISSFINIWNQYMWPLLITNKNEMRPVQVGITLLKFDEGAVYGPTMAAIIIVMIPSIIIFIMFRRNLLGGMTAGAIKG